MHRHSGCCFILRRAAEDVHAEIVAHKTRQQFALSVATVLGVLGLIVSGWLDRGPRRSPKRIDPRRFVQQLRDMTAFNKDGQPKNLVLYLDGATVSISSHITRQFWQPDVAVRCMGPRSAVLPSVYQSRSALHLAIWVLR